MTEQEMEERISQLPPDKQRIIRAFNKLCDSIVTLVGHQEERRERDRKRARYDDWSACQRLR